MKLQAFANLFLLISTWNIANATCSPTNGYSAAQPSHFKAFSAENGYATQKKGRKSQIFGVLFRMCQIVIPIWKFWFGTKSCTNKPKKFELIKIERRRRKRMRMREWKKKVERSEQSKWVLCGKGSSKSNLSYKNNAIATKFCRKQIKWHSNGVCVCLRALYCKENSIESDIDIRRRAPRERASYIVRVQQRMVSKSSSNSTLDMCCANISHKSLWMKRCDAMWWVTRQITRLITCTLYFIEWMGERLSWTSKRTKQRFFCDRLQLIAVLYGLNMLMVWQTRMSCPVQIPSIEQYQSISNAALQLIRLFYACSELSENSLGDRFNMIECSTQSDTARLCREKTPHTHMCV